MSRNVRLLSVVVMGLASATAAADGVGLGVAGKASSLGYGVEVGFRVNDHLALRAGMNSGSYNYSATDSGIAYDYGFEFANQPVLLDWHVFGGTFRLTGGIVNNSNKLKGHASGLIDINGTNYTTIVDTEIKFAKSSTYVGLGWGGMPSKKGGFGMSFDIGVLSHGSPTATMTATGGGVTPGDLAAEQAALNNELKDFKYWPVIALGVGYTF